MYLNDLNQNNSQRGFFKTENNFSYFEMKKKENDQDIKEKILKCLDVTIKNKNIVSR